MQNQPANSIFPTEQPLTAAPPPAAALPRGKYSKVFSALFIFLIAFFFCVFSALGIWQVKRLAWKNNLINHIHARIHLQPVAAPAYAQWSAITAETDEYRPVSINGILLYDRQILVKASVLLNALDETGGSGFWVMTPLQTTDGRVTFINRGFVPAEKQPGQNYAHSLPQEPATVTGLLRMSEANGSLFNKNDPQNHIWYHRNIRALAMAAGLPAENTAPYFIDADAATTGSNLPIGGLTAVHLPNNHLVYAITWFCGALGMIAAAFLTLRKSKRESKPQQ